MSNDWDFKFEDDKKKKNSKVELKSKTRKTSKGHKIKTEILYPDDGIEELLPVEKHVDIKLDYSSHRPRKSRRTYAESLNKDDELPTELPANPIDRILAIGVDYLIILIPYYFAEKIIANVLPLITVRTDLVPFIHEFGAYVLLIASFLLYNIIMPMLTRKTVGMIFFQITVLSEEEELLGLFKLWAREIFFKPICILSVVGLIMMFFKEGKSLCDIMMKTKVASDKVS